jgi:AraC family transcriptional regulator, ethanolamine operon transcriptional activator
VRNCVLLYGVRSLGLTVPNDYQNLARRVSVTPMNAPAPILRTVLSRDVTEHALNLSRWDQTYDQIHRGAFVGRLDEFWIADIQVFRERTSLAVLESGSAWPGSRTFGIPVSMDGIGHYAGRPLPLDSVLTLGPRDALDFRAPASLDIIGISLKAAAFTAFSSACEGLDLESGLNGQRVIAPPASTVRQFRDYMLELFTAVAAHPTRFEAAAVQREVRDQLLERLVILTANAAPESSASFTCSVRREIVNRARAVAGVRPDQPLTVAELCQSLKVSRRSLQYCFQEVLGISPHQYLHSLRLNGLRRALQGELSCGSVQEAAAHWGFWHLSACAAEYKKMFGELPSATLRRRLQS